MSTILIIEDAPNFLRWMGDLLRRQFPQPVLAEAASEREAWEQLWRTQPDVVVLDLGLPKNRPGEPAFPQVGLDLLRTLKSRNGGTKVLVVTSSDDLREECLARGADGFLSKNSRSLRTELTAEIARLLPAAGL